MLKFIVKRMVLLAALLPLGASTFAAPPLAAVSTNRVLVINRSATGVAGGGTATLSIEPLLRTGEIYAGDYQVKVSPYFFKGEKGKLAILVPAAALAKVLQGIAVEITGTATTHGEEGKARRIDAVATPADNESGALKLWFLSGDRKMIFNTSYRFLEK
jgi:hypothetical protein